MIQINLLTKQRLTENNLMVTKGKRDFSDGSVGKESAGDTGDLYLCVCVCVCVRTRMHLQVRLVT